MTEPVASKLDVGTGADMRSIAALTRKATEQAAGLPGVVWLGGYRSDMTGSKAEALCQQAGRSGQACLRFDYSGHGASGGDFRDGTISRWLDESLAVFDRYSSGPQILVGSSMGGWIGLRMVQELRARGQGNRVAGLVLIAPAPDFTLELMEPELTDAQRQALERTGFTKSPRLTGRIRTSSPGRCSRTAARTGCLKALSRPAHRSISSRGWQTRTFHGATPCG
jgi:pimeloyl-ACP methyl ester carboxylesterase